MPSVSLVIAAYNEAESLATVFQRGLSVLQQCTDDYEVVILDLSLIHISEPTRPY